MKTGSMAEVIIHLQDVLADFSIHNHTNINQFHNLKQAKKNLKENELIITEAFTENKLQFETAKLGHVCSQESRRIKSFLCNRP